MSAPPYPFAHPFRPGAPPPFGGMGPPPGAGFPPSRPPPHMGVPPLGGMPPPMPFAGGLGPPRGMGGPRPFGRGPPMMPMGGRPIPPSMPVVLPKPKPAVEKSTTVYVGKIASTVEDPLIRSLLEACGKIKSWKRQEDPETKQLKGFGFCEFQDAEGVLRAIRLLNNVKVDGQELLLKGNSATQKYIEDYESTKEQKKREAKEKAEKEKEQGELNDELDDGDKDNTVLETIMSIVTDREEQQRKKTSDSQRANDFLSKLEHKDQDQLLPPPPRREHTSDRRESRDSRASNAERDLERQYEQRQEEQRKKDESRRRELDREYDRLLKSWEQWERDHAKGRDKEKEHQRSLEKERARQIKADLEASDSEDELEPWQRRAYRSSRRAEERRKRRLIEEREDEIDRRIEEDDMLERAKRHRQEDPDDLQVKAEDVGDAHENGQPVKIESEVKSETSDGIKLEVQEEEPIPTHTPEPQIDPDDPIYQAMMAAAKAPSKPRSPPKPVTQSQAMPIPAQQHQPVYPNTTGANGPVGSLQQPPLSQLGHLHAAAHAQAVQTHVGHTHAAAHAQPAQSHGGHTHTAAGSKAKPKAVNLLAVFGDDDEQENKRRKLVPLQYTEEELKAVSQPAAAVDDPQTALKKMMDTIPTKKEDVFAFKIKWDAYDVATMGTRVSTWVSKKVTEFLGMDEPTLVAFIMQLLSKRKSAVDLMGELSSILDSDTELFVLKLFRMLIYETEKAALGF